MKNLYFVPALMLLSISVFTKGLLELSSCNQLFFTSQRTNTENSDTTIIFKKFPKEENLRFEDFLNPELAYVRGVLLTDTSIILTDDKDFSSGYFFYEYSLTSKKVVGKYIKGGSKKE